MKQLISFLSGIIVAAIIGYAMFWIIHDPTITPQSHTSVSKQSEATTVESSAQAGETSETSNQEDTGTNYHPDAEGAYRALQPNETEKQALELAETFNSNTMTDAEIIVTVTSELVLDYGIEDQNELNGVQDWLTDQGWDRSYWDAEPQDQSDGMPLAVARYFYRQTGRHGDTSDIDDRLGRTQLALGREGYTQDQVAQIMQDLQDGGLEE